MLVIAVGSRGGVAPYTGLGAGLVAAGHEVTIAAHPPFEQDIRRAGSGFAALGGDVRSLVAAPTRPSPMMLARRVDQFTRYLRTAATDAMAAAKQGTDVVLYNSSALFGQDIADGLGVPGLGVFTQPIEPTGDFPPILANSARSLGRWGNRLTGTVVRRTLVPFSRTSALVRQHYGVRSGSRSPVVLHGYSPAVLPRPTDWRAGLDVVGYWWPHQDPTWTPPPDLVDFLAASPAPVFLRFGSMAAARGGL